QQDGEKEISSQFEIEAEEILLHKDGAVWQPVHGRVRLSMQGSADDLQPGMSLMIPARVGPVLNVQTPGVFDYQGYLAAKGIHIKGWVIGEQITVLQEQERNSVRNIVQALCALPEQLRQQVSRFLRHNLPGPIAGTYQALLIGSRAGVSQEIQEHFKATGTMHLLAISGLHMGLLALMIGAIISRLLKRSEQVLLRTHVPTLTLLASLPILFGYSLIAGMNTPALRALIMTIIFFAAIIQRRQHSLPHLLAAAALIVLVRNPLTLFTASFQLSFSAVAALIVFLPAILPSPLNNENDRAGKEEPAVKQNWLAWLAWLARCWQRFILPAFLISVTATLGTLPFMLFHFHRFSLVGPVMNLLVEPFLCFWALPWGLIALLFLFIAPDIALVLFKIGGLGIQAGHWCVALASTQPWASVWTITPTKAEMFCYGTLVLLWGVTLKKDRLRWVTHPLVFLGAGCLVLHFTWSLFFSPKKNYSTVSYLDVGQGTSSFLSLPDGTRVLIDAGGNRHSKRNIGEQVIGPYLWQQRVWRLDQAVITHPHSDHFNGMDFILARFQPKTLFINGAPRIKGKYQDILEQAQQQGIEIILPEAGYEIMKQANADLQIISGAVSKGETGKGARGDVNDASLVLRYQHGKHSFLFPGDISRKKETVLLTQQRNVKADVLLAPHHGSNTSSSAGFIDAVNPALILVSAGRYGKKYYPGSNNLAAWTKRKIPFAVTRDQGTIRCATDGDQLNCLNHDGEVIYTITSSSFSSLAVQEDEL
ncbi:MAG: DNA internalization-related competence protein ComEC/Rec2, partial [Candidatus Electrothrix sp. MAN1_4]|nr:DNA internalization-related competence protein ComEC/Rec2 [Candidatus Electrothrix sp. MAN1_4]